MSKKSSTKPQSGLNTTDLKPNDVGPCGFPVGYNRDGDKVELIEDDPGETFEVVIRRNDGAIQEAIGEFWDKVWYNRKLNMFAAIEEGLEPPLSEAQLDEVHKAMKEVEQHIGKENLPPWDDFEWGMINGKLSALRWVLGHEWDMLDT